MARRSSDIIVGLDIGTTKIAAIVAEMVESGLDVIGLGTHVSRGLKKGVIVNIDSTVAAIKQAVLEAEGMSGCEISQVYVGIAGGHIKGVNSTGTVAIKDKEVRPSDVAKVLELARAIALPVDRHVVHVLPQEYRVDGQDGVREPLGMCGVRLEARVHIVTAAAAALQNIIKCCSRCDLEVVDTVLEPLASGEAVLERDEKDLGVALVDIGGGTTDIAIFTEGAVAHTSVIPLGGHQLTSDIAFGLRTPPHEAEKIKHRWGCALASMVSAPETIEVASVGGRAARVLSRQMLCRDIIQPRIEEIFSFVKAEIMRLGCEDMLASGAVITGGATLLPGMAELAEEVLGIPVRLGMPKGVGGLADVVKSPAFSTGVGLVQYGASQQSVTGRTPSTPSRSGGGIFSRLRRVLSSAF
ncbi:MAG TPA: cell division protein FtsA [Polyangia bacterium]|jgi:cell division protein FtsA|nr:cell division protein FtsA [Polyangia bacterium]